MHVPPLSFQDQPPKAMTSEFDIYKPKVEQLVKAQRNYVNTVIADARKNVAEGERRQKQDCSYTVRTAVFLKIKPLIKLLGEQGVKEIMRKTENHYLPGPAKRNAQGGCRAVFSY